MVLAFENSFFEKSLLKRKFRTPIRNGQPHRGITGALRLIFFLSTRSPYNLGATLGREFRNNMVGGGLDKNEVRYRALDNFLSKRRRFTSPRHEDRKWYLMRKGPLQWCLCEARIGVCCLFVEKKDTLCRTRFESGLLGPCSVFLNSIFKRKFWTSTGIGLMISFFTESRFFFFSGRKCMKNQA